MSLLLVKDNANSKIRELECDANGLLKVDKVDVSALATEASLSSMNGKIVSCDTGSVTVSSCALPTGAASESTLSTLNGKIVSCDTGSVTVSSCALPTGGATSALQSSGNTSLSAIDGKIVSCDTGSVTVSSCALPTGGATSALQSTGNTSLATLAGCVSANVLSVSAGSVSKTASYVWGSGASTASISGSSSANSSVFDCRTLQKIVITGNTSNLNDSNIEIEVSHDNSEFFELTDAYLSIDYNTGHFGKSVDAPFNYVRLKRSNTQLTSESIKAVISGF